MENNGRMTVHEILNELSVTANACRSLSNEETYNSFATKLQEIIDSGRLPPCTIKLPNQMARFNKYRDAIDECAMEQNFAGGSCIDPKVEAAIKTRGIGDCLFDAARRVSN